MRIQVRRCSDTVSLLFGNSEKRGTLSGLEESNIILSRQNKCSRMILKLCCRIVYQMEKSLTKEISHHHFLSGNFFFFTYLDHLWKLLHPFAAGSIVPGFSLPSVAPFLDAHLPSPSEYKGSLSKTGNLHPSSEVLLAVHVLALCKSKKSFPPGEWENLPMFQGVVHLFHCGYPPSWNITCQNNQPLPVLSTKLDLKAAK